MSLPVVEVSGRGPSGSPPDGADPVVLEEVSVVVSDIHISEGLERNEKYRPSRLRRFWNWFVGLFSSVECHPAINPKNPLEDFPDDGKFVTFLEKVVETYGQCPVIRLRLNGDTFDPLAVTWNGKFSDPPYEQAAAGKMGRIIDGHPRFFDALAAFIRLSNCHVDIFVGNHDLFLVWDRVQRKLMRRLTGGDAELAKKVRIVDQRMRFRDLHREVLYVHGHDAEANNTIDPDSVVLTHRFGRQIKHPILNAPYGSFMTVGLVNRIKQKNPLVGRLTNYKALWRNAAIHRWGWAAYCLLATVGNYLSNAFFDIWDVRRKTRLSLHLKVVLQTMEDQPVDTYAKKLLREYAGKVKAVFLGHSHEHRRVTGPEGTYINTGTWGLQFDLRWRKFEEHEFKWKRFRQLETVWLTTKHLFKTGELRFATYITRVLGWVAFVLALVVFLLYSFPKEGWKIWSYQVSDFKLPAGILLIFLLVSGLVRLLSARPEVVVTQRLTFGLVRHWSDGSLNAELMEYLPEERTFRECV